MHVSLLIMNVLICLARLGNCNGYIIHLGALVLILSIEELLGNC